MKEAEILRIISELKKIILKPMSFGGLIIELVDVKRAKHNPGHTVLRHHHPWFEFNWFFDGSYTTYAEGNEILSENGDILLMPPGVDHAHINGDKGDDSICIRWQISEGEGGVNEYASALLKETEKYEIKSQKGNINIFKNLGMGILGNQTVFLSWVVSLYSDRLANTNPERNTSNQISNQVTLYLKEYYKNNFTANDVAHALNMSYRNLSRVFKKETGVTIVEKLNEIRINEARRLLIETELPVSKIAEEVGFINVYYFSSTFKKYVFTSPKEYRKMNK